MPSITPTEINTLIGRAAQYYSFGNDTSIGKVESYLMYVNIYNEFYKKMHGLRFSADIDVARIAYVKAKETAGENNIEAFKEAFSQIVSKEFYLITDPVFLVINKLNERINELKSEWNPFKRSPQNKIQALENLVERLLTIEQGTVGEVIIGWSQENIAAIEQPRNFFKRQNAREQLTKTEEFINTLSNQFRDISLEGQRAQKPTIYKPFEDYLNSRTSLWERIITFFFRNSSLSLKKSELAKNAVDEIQSFRGSYNQLVGRLEVLKKENAILSREHGKNHFNLDERRNPIRVSKNRWEPEIQEDELGTESELAEAYHQSLESVRI